MSTRNALLKWLSDGAFHSGTALGERLGVTRAAIHKAVQSLNLEAGLDIHCVPGKGYRLAEPFVPLSMHEIRGGLPEPDGSLQIEVMEHTDSTSQELWRKDPKPRSGQVCLAEQQSAGRGRRGRNWIASPYRNILLSMCWQFESGPSALSGLSLAAGVAVVQALEDFGVHEVALKWPNDILWQGRKMAGLLVDVRGETGGPSVVVLGLGLNVFQAEREAKLMDQPWAMLRDSLPGPVDRNRLASLLITRLAVMFRSFADSGFDPVREQWERRHLYQERPVQVHLGNTIVNGVAIGVDALGNLRLRVEHGDVRVFHSGEVSLRAVA